MHVLQDVGMERDRHLVLGDEPAETQGDVRGYVVYDRNHRKLGIVSEVYCSSDDLKPRYLEIAPFKERDESTFLTRSTTRGGVRVARSS